MRRLLFLVLALVLLGAAACTQQRPAVPTPTLVPLTTNETPVLPLSNSPTPGGPEVTTPPAGAPTETAPAAVEPTLLPTPTGATGELPTAGPPPPEAEATAVPSNPSPGGSTATGACPNPYTVQRGDWLYQIARKCGVSPQAIVAANRGINPNYVFPGQVLQIPGGGSAPPPGGGQGNPPPPTGGGRTYVVQRGDNLFRIALRFGVSLYALMQANGIANPNFIFVGQVLRIP